MFAKLRKTFKKSSTIKIVYAPFKIAVERKFNTAAGSKVENRGSFDAQLDLRGRFVTKGKKRVKKKRKDGKGRRSEKGKEGKEEKTPPNTFLVKAFHTLT